METILTLTYLYLLVLLLALLIERTMEVLMALWEFLELKFEGHRIWNRRAARLKDRFAGKVNDQLGDTGVMAMEIGQRTKQYTNVVGEVAPGTTVVFSAASVRRVFVRTVAFIITTMLGVLLCNWAGINLIALVREAIAPTPLPMLEIVGPQMQRIISGLVVGLGAEPVHRMIKRLEATQAWLEQRRRLNERLADSVERQIDNQ